MKKSNELLQLVMEDLSLKNTEEVNINTIIDIARKNTLYSKLSLLVGNSDSEKKCVIECINKASNERSNDFRVFTLLLLLSDVARPESIELSRVLVRQTELRTTRLIARNILLRESMYGNKY
jgi:hypothetical protein